MEADTSYNDEYSTCRSTFSTLRFYSDDISPFSISEVLDIEPTEYQVLGEPLNKGGYREGKSPLIYKQNGWLLSTKSILESKDFRRHLDWILDRIEDKGEALRHLLDQGVDGSISCYWLSAYGHGGPQLNSQQARRLGGLGLGLWFDFYYFDESE